MQDGKGDGDRKAEYRNRLREQDDRKQKNMKKQLKKKKLVSEFF